jgi:transposase-like protein
MEVHKMRKRNKYSKEFKLSILNELLSKKAVEVCREHNIHPVMISKWKKEFNQDPIKCFSGNGNLWKLEAENEKYKRLVGELYAEIDFLKKTNRRLMEISAEEKKVKSIR